MNKPTHGAGVSKLLILIRDVMKERTIATSKRKGKNKNKNKETKGILTYEAT